MGTLPKTGIEKKEIRDDISDTHIRTNTENIL